MEINTDIEMLSMMGDPIKTPLEPGKPPEVLTLKNVLLNCLINETEGDKLDAKKKIERYDLALRVKDGGKVELTAEEISLIKESISKQFPVIVTGQAHRILEGKPTGLERKK
jgi:hypothetical protein